jgi:UDP-N-acetylmuramyl pentapeptide phosphotransferase/UDP-N-acetylglucosamine-1-phosphate transferase
MSIVHIIEMLCTLSIVFYVLSTLIMLFISVFDDYKSVRRDNEENKSNEER